MMQEPLPPELRELESRLQGRCTGEPSADVRGRVLGAVEKELADEGGKAARRGLTWSYAAAAAAAAVLGMNLSMEAVWVTRFVDGRQSTAEQLESTAASIQRFAPELGPVEARRLAVVMSAGEKLVAAPLPRGLQVGTVELTLQALQER